MQLLIRMRLLNLRDDTVEICPGAFFKGAMVASVGNASAVETIGAYVFEDCANLVGIELSSSFWSSEITLGVGAFKLQQFKQSDIIKLIYGNCNSIHDI